MKDNSIEKLFEFYNDTLNLCGAYLLHEDDETIEYNIFEEFDIGIISFFYPDNLLLLCNSGYISKNKMEKSIELRFKILQLQNTEEWQINCVKTSDIWREILILSDRIRELN